MGFRSVRDRIRRAKEEHGQAQNVKRTKQLQKLRHKREKVEGKARLGAAIAAEKSRITKARDAERGRSRLGRLTKAVRAEIKTAKKKRKSREGLFEFKRPRL